MDMRLWQDDESLRLRAALDAQSDPVPFESVRISQVVALFGRVVQKAGRVLSSIARHS